MQSADRVERRLRLQDLRVLMAVVQAGSMGKAADQLGTSQPAISRAIAELERMLGVALLDRGSHGVEATPFGLLVIKRGMAVFDELRQTVRDIEFLTNPSAGEISDLDRRRRQLRRHHRRTTIDAIWRSCLRRFVY
jgi:DNA-binding transcriptional LysR family regulator